jgi:hypothetical protein
VVADGGAWIWNIVADCFAETIGVLDFYHASQHLWELTHSLHPTNAAAAQAWGGSPVTPVTAWGGSRGVPHLAGIADLVRGAWPSAATAGSQDHPLF